MRILILGGTGAMGVHLVDLLSKTQDKVFVTSRSERDSYENITYIQGNANQDEFIAKLMQKKWDAIIDFMVYSTESFKNRVELLLKATSQYIFISSARVYAETNPVITESSPKLLHVSKDEEYLSTDEYALTKARQEDILKISVEKNYTIIRPYITYSERRLQLGVLEKEDWLYRASRGRTIVFSEDMIDKRTTLTYGLDVSFAIFKIIGKQEALGNEFHVTNNQSVTWRYVLNVYKKVIENHTNKKTKILLQNKESFFKHHDAKYQALYDRFYNRCFDNSKISKLVDTREFIEVEKGLQNCLQEFFKNPHYIKINWRKEAVKDRATGEFASLLEIKKLKDIARYLKYRFF
ncbi:NAD-dependent epimerase/dehydratase family protein [Wenyingzhuangia sp. chi5]|uniref:NAD-dependent epimerase/dehydratase family protein n=1 Tax=Wenyingzhuangia gilva TaxID=3057677 RepID=A0ABT8VNV1_9FLAO|nr:NAD-dependent epimerase/dehydratase family protein [Wenyingzhuangia sp. chi5]MDO3693636.1 NAD-dependent epimerase/dehydratase family protein [Wenyingzhuangia sp. chi5]